MSTQVDFVCKLQIAIFDQNWGYSDWPANFEGTNRRPQVGRLVELQLRHPDTLNQHLTSHKGIAIMTGLQSSSVGG